MENSEALFLDFEHKFSWAYTKGPVEGATKKGDFTFCACKLMFYCLTITNNLLPNVAPIAQVEAAYCLFELALKGESPFFVDHEFSPDKLEDIFDLPDYNKHCMDLLEDIFAEDKAPEQFRQFMKQVDLMLRFFLGMEVVTGKPLNPEEYRRADYVAL